jgi:hypothetical protein
VGELMQLAVQTALFALAIFGGSIFGMLIMDRD